jgi:N-glycosylase/DNA lyase
LIPQTRFKTVLKTVDWLKRLDFFCKPVSAIALAISHEYFKVRYRNRKAFYLLEMKDKFDKIYEILTSTMTPDDKRQWLMINIKGLGYKTSSHLLRNLGYQEFAIIDTHIKKFMKLDDKKWNYLKVEQKFRKIATKHNLSPAQLDAIIWQNQAGVTEEEFQY